MEPISPRDTTIEALRATLKYLEASSSSESEEPALQNLKHQIVATLAEMDSREHALTPSLADLAPGSPAAPADLAAALLEDQPPAPPAEVPAALLDAQPAAVDDVTTPDAANPPPASKAA